MCFPSCGSSPVDVAFVWAVVCLLVCTLVMMMTAADCDVLMVTAVEGAWWTAVCFPLCGLSPAIVRRLVGQRCASVRFGRQYRSVVLVDGGGSRQCLAADGFRVLFGRAFSLHSQSECIMFGSTSQG